MGAGQDVTLTYNVRPTEVITLTSQDYRITADGGYTVNGSDMVMTQVLAEPVAVEPSLSILKSVTRAEAQVGEIITYTLRVVNSGDGEATNLTVTDVIPVGATYLQGGTLSQDGSQVSWAIPSLAGGGSIEAVTFVVAAAQTITNSTYTVSADGGYQAAGRVAIVTDIESGAACTPGVDAGCPTIDGELLVYLPLMLRE